MVFAKMALDFVTHVSAAHQQVVSKRRKCWPAFVSWAVVRQEWDECAMEQYAVFHGEWHPYYGDYVWQPLEGGHRALGDCRAVLERIREIAEYPNPWDGE